MASGVVDRAATRARRVEVADVESVLCDVWDRGGTILDVPTRDERGSLVARFVEPSGAVVTIIQSA